MISSEKLVSPGRRPKQTEIDRPPLRVFNDYGEEVFSVGQWASAGTYRQVDSARIITLEEAGPLPPSFDGRRAEYCRIERPWATATTNHN